MQQNKAPFSVTEAEDSSGFLLWQVTNLWHREIKKMLEEYNITHSQFVLLTSAYWLTIHNCDVTQIVLSQHTKIDPMTTSTVLRTLQRKGFIKRFEPATDTRAKAIVLTELGIETVKKTVVAVEAFDVAFFSFLPNGKQFNKNLQVLLRNNQY